MRAGALVPSLLRSTARISLELVSLKARFTSDSARLASDEPTSCARAAPEQINDVVEERARHPDRHRTDQAPGAGLLGPAGERRRDPGFPCQRLESVDAVGHHCQVPTPLEAPGEAVDGARCVERHGSGRWVCSGSSFSAIRPFDLALCRCRWTNGSGPERHRATPDAACRTQRLQFRQVAPDGHLAHAELDRQIVDADAASFDDETPHIDEPLFGADRLVVV